MVKLKLSRWGSGTPRFVFVLGVFLLVCMASFSKFYSFKPFLVSDTLCNDDSKPHVSYRGPSMEILETVIKKIEHEITDTRDSHKDSPYGLRYGSFLADVLGLIESAKLAHIGSTEAVRSPSSEHKNGSVAVHVSPEYFLTEEIRKYVRIKPNRLRKQNFMGANGTFTSIGHACFLMKEELEAYMDYDVGEICNDDWRLAQRLMVHGCDPLPRRRCFSRAPELYTKPFPINQSIWSLPDDKNVRWSNYRCKNFTCLATNKTGKGFFKCADCFNLTHHEAPRWVAPVHPDPASNSTPDFLITDVLDL